MLCLLILFGIFDMKFLGDSIDDSYPLIMALNHTFHHLSFSLMFLFLPLPYVVKKALFSGLTIYASVYSL